MDPISAAFAAVIFTVVFTRDFVKNLYQDRVYKARGQDPPSYRRERERAERRREKAAARVPLVVREDAPARRFVAVAWRDAWESAKEREQRRHARASEQRRRRWQAEDVAEAEDEAHARNQDEPAPVEARCSECGTPVTGDQIAVGAGETAVCRSCYRGTVEQTTDPQQHRPEGEGEGEVRVQAPQRLCRICLNWVDHDQMALVLVGGVWVLACPTCQDPDNRGAENRPGPEPETAPAPDLDQRDDPAPEPTPEPAAEPAAASQDPRRRCGACRNPLPDTDIDAGRWLCSACVPAPSDSNPTESEVAPGADQPEGPVPAPAAHREDKPRCRDCQQLMPDSDIDAGRMVFCSACDSPLEEEVDLPGGDTTGQAPHSPDAPDREEVDAPDRKKVTDSTGRGTADADQDGGAQIIQFSVWQQAASATSTDQENQMNAEITGLQTALGFTDGMAGSADKAVTETETSITRLTLGGVTGPTIAALTQAQEALGQAAAHFRNANAELTRHIQVQEAYHANPDAGTREFVNQE